jgi:hypothetical protein
MLQGFDEYFALRGTTDQADVLSVRSYFITHLSYFVSEAPRVAVAFPQHCHHFSPGLSSGPRARFVQPLEKILLFIVYVSDPSYLAAFCLKYCEIWTQLLNIRDRYDRAETTA